MTIRTFFFPAFLLLASLLPSASPAQAPAASSQKGTATGKQAPKTIGQIKAAIEQSRNGPLYVKDVLKKKFTIDTITILRTRNFSALADSIAYHGKVGKVYGPFEKGKILVQVLDKAPNRFNHIAQLFLDTTLFRARFADSLADQIIGSVMAGRSSFEDMVRTYSMGGEAATGGDMGWTATGAMLPVIEKELAKRKKGELFKVWTANGLHIIRKLDDAKEDDGFALLMRIFL